MKFFSLDGRPNTLRLSGKEADPNRPASSGHRRARALLFELYPFDTIYEEVHLPGAKWDLYVDLLVPSRKLAVEIQGEQHRKFNLFFHGTPAAFREQARRDVTKRHLLEFNGFRLVAIDDDHPPAGWASLIRGDDDGQPDPVGGPDGAAARPPAA